jgi:hypothetical protein
MTILLTCPACYARLRFPEQTRERVLVCPRCGDWVDNPAPGLGPTAGDIHSDVRRDLRLGGIVLAVLIALCILGASLAFVRPGGEYAKLELAYVLGFIFAALDILVTIACAIALWRWGLSGVGDPSARAILGILFLILATIVAVVIFFFATCVALVILK